MGRAIWMLTQVGKGLIRFELLWDV